MCGLLVVAGIGRAMAKRLENPTVTLPGPAVRARLIDRAARTAERYGNLPAAPWLKHLERLESRTTPVLFRRWEVRGVWPEAAHDVMYYLEPDDTIREAVKDGDTWR